MSILSRNQVIERALRKIGSYSINATAPRPREVEEAAYWLDMTVAHQASRARTWWLVDTTATFPLVATQTEYELKAAIGPANLPRGIQFVIGAWLHNNTTGEDLYELKLEKRDEYEDHRDKARQGVPCSIYVNRDDSPTAWLYPTPSNAESWSVRLLFQSYAPDFLNAKPTDKAYKMRESWNLWMVTALAAQLASGPIRMLPQDEVKLMISQATTLRNELEAYEDREQANEPRQVAYWDGIS